MRAIHDLRASDPIDRDDRHGWIRWETRDEAVPRGVQRAERLRVGKSAADHHSVRAVRPVADGVLASAAPNRRGRRRHRCSAGSPIGHGVRRAGRRAGHRRALCTPAASAGLRRLRLGASVGHRTRGHHRAPRGCCDRAARRHRQHRVCRADRHARVAGRWRLPRRPTRTGRVDRRLLLAGSAGRIHHRGCRGADSRSARQVGRPLQR